MSSDLEKKFELWRKDEEKRQAGFSPAWDEKVTWRKAEVDALPKALIRELASSLDSDWGRTWARKLFPEWEEEKLTEERKIAWEKKGGVLGVFILKGGGTYTLRLTGNTINVPAGEEGRVIGRGGRNIKRIAQVTGVNPKIISSKPLSMTVKQTVWNI